VTPTLSAAFQEIVCELPADQEISGDAALEAALVIGGKAAFIALQLRCPDLESQTQAAL